MYSKTAFLSLIILVILTDYSSAGCAFNISCPCGVTNIVHKFCINEDQEKDLNCDPWAQCETCANNITHCITCPEGKSGLRCNGSSPEHKLIKRQLPSSSSVFKYFHERRISEKNIGKDSLGPCPQLDNPESGSKSCEEESINSRSYKMTCTGRCLPGYSFEDDENQEEMTLECTRGYWEPRKDFPACKSRGQCDLQLIGSGSFNCTTVIDGTRCDVTCDGVHRGWSHCYPGSGWRPPLPYCVKPKEGGGSIRPPRRSCRCQNGGRCDRNGKCSCPQGYVGTYCEKERTATLSCSDPGTPSGAIRFNSAGSPASSPRNFNPGQSLVFSCSDPDSSLRGSSLLTCRSDGTWSAPVPMCVRPTERPATLSCIDPGTPSGAIRFNSAGRLASSPRIFNPGQSLVFSCSDPDSSLRGSSLLTCRSDGTWSAPVPRCVRPTARPTDLPGCQLPNFEPNGRVVNGPRGNASQDSPFQSNRRTYPPGSFVVIACNDGYEPKEPVKAICLLGGNWDSVLPVCSRIVTTTPSSEVYCRQPVTNVNSVIVADPLIDSRRRGQTYPPGTELTFQCEDGFSPIGTTILFCLRSGQWTSNPPYCMEQREQPTYPPMKCPFPGVDTNGRIENLPPLDSRRRGRGFETGDELLYTCEEGYDMVGVNIITCMPDGEWSYAPPVCELGFPNVVGSWINCESIGLISNGRVVVFRSMDDSNPSSDVDDFEYPPGTKLQYSCETGYVIAGPDTLVCQPSGIWSTKQPICVEDCGRSLLQATHRIKNGNRTVAGEWPWTVAISVTSNRVTTMKCGGVLLDRQTVMTAAHCLLESDQYVLYFGKFYSRDRQDDNFVVRRTSSRIIMHPDFNNATFDNDIALIKFVPSVTYNLRIRPICLPTERSNAVNVVPGQKGYVTGWGLTEKQLLSDELLVAHLPVQPDDECVKSYENMGLRMLIHHEMFCAGISDGSVSACRGDSGSPLVFFDNKTERYIVEGLVSFGVDGECGQPGMYTVFTKVADFIPWLRGIRGL